MSTNISKILPHIVDIYLGTKFCVQETLRNFKCSLLSVIRVLNSSWKTVNGKFAMIYAHYINIKTSTLTIIHRYS